MTRGRTWTVFLVIAAVALAAWLLLRPRQPGARLPGEQQRPQVTIALNDGDEGRAIKDLASAYEAAEVQVVELPYQNLREKLGQVLGANRSTYDLVMLDDPWFPELAPNLRALDPIPEWLESDLIPASLALGRLPYPDGETRALAYVGNCQLLFYRADILEEVGWVEPPETWQGVLEVGEALRRQGAQAHGYCVRAKSGAAVVSDFLPVLWSVGGGVFEESGDVTQVAIGGPETTEALALYRRLVELSPPGAAAFDYPEMLAEFAAGNAALELTWPAAVADLDRQIPRLEDGSRRWGVALPPSGREGVEGTSMAGNWLLGIPAASDQPGAATALLLWLFEQQKQAAEMGNPPTRRSVYEEFAGDDRFFHYEVLRGALERSTPRPRTALWARIEDLISEQVTAVVTDRTTVKAAAEALASGVTEIVSNETRD